MLCRELVIDTSAVINIVNGNIGDQCLKSIDPEVEVTPQIERECEGKMGTADALQSFLDLGLLKKTQIAITVDDLLEFMERNNLGAGESEAILSCQKSGCHLWCDDRRARTVGGAVLGNTAVTGTLGIMRDLIGKGALNADLCFGAYQAMRAAGGFLPVISEDFFQGA